MCLILVCVLVVSWSPIRAQASALPEVAGVVTKVIPFAKVVEPAALGVGGTVFCWVALGLGLVFTAKEAVDAYNAYQDFTGDLEMSIYYYPDGTWSYGVDMTFVERVREFLWESGTLTVLPPVAHEMTTAQTNEMVSFMNEYSHVFCWVFNNEWHFAASNAGYFSVSPTNTWHKVGCRGASGSISFKVWTMSSTASDRGSYSWVDIQNLWEGAVWFWCGPEDDVTIYSEFDLGVVAPQADPFPVGYPDWHINSRPATNPDTDEEITVLPIPLNPSADPETQIGSVTQPDIWQGALADPMPDTDTNPDTGTDTDPDTQPDSPGAPSSDIGDYQIDLKKFFPFCIPFDLYDFFTCLNADPVAPVIEWVIPLPGGDTYPLVIDLSAFDSVAQLLRRLQLLLFCVGLAFKTRDLIKG